VFVYFACFGFPTALFRIEIIEIYIYIGVAINIKKIYTFSGYLNQSFATLTAANMHTLLTTKLLIRSLLLLAFLLPLPHASPLTPRDISPVDSITYCTPLAANTSCTAFANPSSPIVFEAPAAPFFAHFECFINYDGQDRYLSSHPAPGKSECFVDAAKLGPKTGCDQTSCQCSKASLVDCCVWGKANGVEIPGYFCEVSS